MAAAKEFTSNRSLFQHLREIGCCKRCSLRHIGERDHLSYVNVDCIIKQKGLVNGSPFDNEPELKIAKSNPCIACLGILEDATIADIVEKVASDVLKSDYDCTGFSCVLHLPISLQLRAHSMSLHLATVSDAQTVPVPLKEAWKWCAAPLVADRIDKKLDNGQNAEFFIEVHISYAAEEKECSSLLSMHPDVYKIRFKQKRKYNGLVFTRKSVETSLATTEPALFVQHFSSPPPLPDQPITFEKVICVHNAIYIAGRYNKYSRALSQTPWVLDGERKMESSVQEIICEDIRDAMQAEGLKFSSSGREDVDVRMLGRGRPFVCELTNPHRVRPTAEQLRQLQRRINSNSPDQVIIRDLQLVDKSELNELKKGEDQKTKVYSALCCCTEQLTQPQLDRLAEVVDLPLNQKTPIRVLHRRPLATRIRMIHSMQAKLTTKPDVGSLFVLTITTQAGTYVKEFVHGDFGRTKPSLGDILKVPVDILALDVQEINLDWPQELMSNETD